jgi:hypothetical protein
MASRTIPLLEQHGLGRVVSNRTMLCYLGKTTFFVVNQAKLETASPEKLASLDAEYKTIDDANKLRVNEIRIASNGAFLTRFRQPTIHCTRL